MNQYRLNRGLTIHVDNQRYVLQRLIENEIQFEDIETGRVKMFRRDFLVSEILKGSIKIVSTSSEITNKVQKSNNNNRNLQILGNLTEKERKRFDLRCQYVREISKLGIELGSRQQLQDNLLRLSRKFGDAAPPSASTVMRWLKRFQESGDNYLALLDGYCTGPRASQFDGWITEKITGLLQKYYLTRQGDSVAKVYNLMLSDSEMYVPDESQIGGKRPLISRSSFYRLVNQIPAYERDRARLGAAAARAKWRHSIGGIYTSRPLERVEMDHTVLDLYVIDDVRGIPLGRPVITILIDAFSQYILALYVGFEGESLGRVVRAIRIALSPKTDLTEMAKTENEWLFPGLFECLVVDNSLSFQSPQLHEIALTLGIEIEYGAVRQPWFKGSVERAMGSITRMLPKQGRPEKPNGGVKDPKNPLQDACIKFSDLNVALIKWVVDVHPFSINQRTLKRPFDLMTEGLKKMPAPVFVKSLEGLEFFTSLSKPVVVSHAGIEFQYLSYRSTELRNLVLQQSAPKFKTKIKYNPDDLGYIWVMNPKNNEWIKVPCMHQEYASGLTLYQHKYIRAESKENLKRNCAEEVYLRAQSDLQVQFDSAIRRGKNSIRHVKKMAQFEDISSSTPSVSASLSEKNKPELPIEQPAVKIDEQIISQEIPRFDAYDSDEF